MRLWRGSWRGAAWGYDVALYTELMMRAVESVFTPFGITASMLRSWLVKELPAENLHSRLEAKPARAYFGPLFEPVIPRLPIRRRFSSPLLESPANEDLGLIWPTSLDSSYSAPRIQSSR